MERPSREFPGWSTSGVFSRTNLLGNRVPYSGSSRRKPPARNCSPYGGSDRRTLSQPAGGLRAGTLVSIMADAAGGPARRRVGQLRRRIPADSVGCRLPVGPAGAVANERRGVAGMVGPTAHSTGAGCPCNGDRPARLPVGVGEIMASHDLIGPGTGRPRNWRCRISPAHSSWRARSSHPVADCRDIR